MSQSSLLLLLGVLTMFAPFAGLPSSWVAVLTALFGLLVAIVGLSIRVQKVRDAKAQEMPLTPSAEPAPAPVIPHGVSPI